jgi:hypothetical protein
VDRMRHPQIPRLPALGLEIDLGGDQCAAHASLISALAELTFG